MLETIRDSIQKMHRMESFNSYFLQYVMDIQDSNIDKEMSYMLSHNVVSIDMIDRAILKDLESLVKTW